jgi:NADH dehydrogenase
MILVVGSTGVLGRDVVRLLRAEGRPVRAMARSAVKASDLASLGAEVVQGDLVDPASLARACAGATHVVAAAHGMLGSGRNRSEAVDDTGHRALVDTARVAGIAHFVYTSALGASPGHPLDFFRTKYAVEQYVKGLGLTYTILRPSAFMETHAHTFNGKGIVERGKTTLLGRGTRPRNFVAVRDVAAMAVRALADPAMRGQTIEIGGPQNFTDNQVAALYGRVLGVTPKVAHVPPALLRIAEVVLKPFAPGVSRIMRLSGLRDDAYDATFDPTATLKAYPMRLTTLEEFIREKVKRDR